ncbi:MAG TPA: tetratricopeptide repeat protein, partial [Pyrinomonadaceae bacterium]|nr:tetratricopeptide repeat protein [Pyrinomonadaceae bacterium]
MPETAGLIVNSAIRNRLLAILLGLALIFQSLALSWAVGLLPQDIAGGVAAFRGQDIMGGAAIVFKRPQRLRDIVGGAAMLVVKRQPRPVRTTEVASRVTPTDRRRPPPTVASTRVTEEDKGEAFKNQGNTYYDLGKFAEAIEAYQNALKHTPKDPFVYNNLGAAYFSIGKNKEATDAFNKALSLKDNDPDAYFNLGIAYAAL